MPWTWQEAVGWLEIFTVIWMAERGREGGRERERKDESWAWCLFNMPTQSMCPADHWEGCWGGCYSRNTVITLSQRGYFKTISQRLVQKKKKKKTTCHFLYAAHSSHLDNGHSEVGQTWIWMPRAAFIHRLNFICRGKWELVVTECLLQPFSKSAVWANVNPLVEQYRPSLVCSRHRRSSKGS